jgi:hypothetical protein
MNVGFAKLLKELQYCNGIASLGLSLSSGASTILNFIGVSFTIKGLNTY